MSSKPKSTGASSGSKKGNRGATSPQSDSSSASPSPPTSSSTSVSPTPSTLASASLSTSTAPSSSSSVSSSSSGSSNPDWFKCTEGSVVRVTDGKGSVVEGAVFCLDLPSKCLVLEKGIEPKDYVVMGINNIRSVETLKTELPADHEPDSGGKGRTQLHVMEFLQGRERKAVAERKKESSKIGSGVSAEGQMIFDSLSKTIPCEWDKTSIVVMKTIRINVPYGLDDVINTGDPHDDVAYSRVKLMLEKEAGRARVMLEKTASTSATSPPPLPSS